MLKTFHMRKKTVEHTVLLTDSASPSWKRRGERTCTVLVLDAVRRITEDWKECSGHHKNHMKVSGLCHLIWKFQALATSLNPIVHWWWWWFHVDPSDSRHAHVHDMVKKLRKKKTCFQLSLLYKYIETT